MSNHSAAATQFERLGDSDQAGRLRGKAAIIRGTLEHVAAVAATHAP